MMSTYQKTKLQKEFIGPTPHSGAMRARAVTSSRPLPPDQLFAERRRQEASRHQGAEFCRKQQAAWQLKNDWERSTAQRFVRETVDRDTQNALERCHMTTEERRDRLRSMLQTEDQDLQRELEATRETVLERQARMRERARSLKETRERERLQLVEDKMEQLYREQSEELRATQTQRRQDQVCVERAAQLRSAQAERRQRQEEEELYVGLWEADRLAKEGRSQEEGRRQRRSNQEVLVHLQAQVEEAEQQRQEAKQLKEQEAQLLRTESEALRAERHQALVQKQTDQEALRRQLDGCLRIKTRRLQRELCDAQAVDARLLETLQSQDTDEEEEAARRKLQRQQEERQYRAYLQEQREEQSREEQQEQSSVGEQLHHIWTEREERKQLEGRARSRLMRDVMDGRRLQLQHRVDQSVQQKLQLDAEKTELSRTVQEFKELDEEQKRSHKQSCEQHKQDLLDQMKHRQALLEADRVLEEREHQQGLLVQERYRHKMEDILSQPVSSSSSAVTTVHPFRRSAVQC